MKFRIWTILWVFAVLASALATFGGAGLLIGVAVIGAWSITKLPDRPSLNEMLMYLLGTGVVIAFFLVPALNATRVRSLSASCRDNMKHIALALLTYKDVHGQFPPAYTTDQDGNRLHSWRVLILPYLEERELYEAINLEEPWNSPENREHWSQIPYFYRCPSCNIACRSGALQSNEFKSNYFAIVDEQTIWPGGSTLSEPVLGSLVFPPKTLLLLEAADAGTCWMEPADLSFEESIQILRGARPGHVLTVNEYFYASVSSNGTNYACIDGHVEYLHRAEERAARYLSRESNEGEILESRIIFSRKPFSISEFVRWSRIYSLSFFAIMSVLPLATLRRKHKDSY